MRQDSQEAEAEALDMATPKFISKAIRHPGELRKFAHEVGCTTAKGNVDLNCIGSHIKKIHDKKRRSHLMHALNLARTLHGLRKVKHR